MQWDAQFADRTAQMKRSTVREILKLTSQPDMISFAGGLPAPELFPVDRIREATDTVLAERGREALQYSTSEGMPELRGWVAAATAVIDKLVQVKQATDLHTGTLSQFITYEIVRDEAAMQGHIEVLKNVYRERRNLMLATLQEQFPAGVTWTTPTGGLFLMVTLPEHMDATEVLKAAVQEKVAFVPGESFYITPEGATHAAGMNTFRLNYSNARPERIIEGITRLGGVLKRMMAG